MRDIVIIYPTAPDTSWDLDIDIVDGQPRYVSEPGQTQDQRAAVAALIGRGTIPGNLTLGVDWGGLLTDQVFLVAIDNEVKQMISKYAAEGNDSQLITYVPIYNKNKKGGVDVQVYRA